MTRFLLIFAVLALCFTGCLALPEQTAAPTTKATTEVTTAPTTTHIHSYTENLVEATCTEKGYTQYTCTCGDSYRDKEVEALGHTEIQEVIPATKEAPGRTVHTCTRCGETQEDGYIWLAATPTDFFDDAAFIGDSITLGLRNYNMDRNQLGTATILCQGSYSVAHAVNNTMYLSYQGEDMTPQDALKACGANKVFILLGMNDIALYGVDKSLENWAVFVKNLRSENPDIAIYIQSGTPIYTAGQIGGLNNTRMDEYNDRLQFFAKENNCYYVDVATAMKDSTNGLATQYASDNYVHLTYAACELWVEILKNYVGQ